MTLSAALFDLLKKDLSDSLDRVDSPRDFAIRHQLDNLEKRRRDAPSASLKEVALREFEERCLSPIVELPSLLYATAFIRKACPVFREEHIAEGMRPGPGSSLGMLDQSTCGFLKLAYSKSAVSSLDLYREYLGLIQEYNHPLYSAELLRRQKFGYPELTPFNKVITVPKDNTKDRVIAIEPTINSVMQQGVAFCLTRNLADLGIHIESPASDQGPLDQLRLPAQPFRNRWLARRGSLGDGLATVDFSAASDSIQWNLIFRLFGETNSSYIRLVSSPQFSIEGRLIPADKIALSMGNAVTFPLQTLIFLSLAVEAFKRCNIPYSINENIAVFGDDVIIDDRVVQTFLEVSSMCGFKANAKKTFVDGPFRESCGADWYLGYNVRPFMIRHLDKVVDAFVAYNLISAWSRRWRVDLRRSLAILEKHLRKTDDFLYVPMHSPINSGIRVARPHGHWVKTLSAVRYPAYVVTKKDRSLNRLDAPSSYLVQGHLYGWLRAGKIMERPRNARYNIRHFVTSSWSRIESDEQWLYDDTCMAF